MAAAGNVRSIERKEDPTGAGSTDRSQRRNRKAAEVRDQSGSGIACSTGWGLGVHWISKQKFIYRRLGYLMFCALKETRLLAATEATNLWREGD